MNIYNSRHVVFGGVLVLIASKVYSVGLGVGFLAITVPMAWLLVLLLVTKVIPPSFKFAFVVIKTEGGQVDLSTVALCVSMAMLLAPLFVYLAESLNNAFGSLAGGDVLTYFILRAGVVEELLKFTAVFLVVRYLAPGAIKHPLDGMVLACSAALGFAAYENFFHNLYFAEAGDGVVAKAFLLGTFIRVPLHALYGEIWGAAFGISRFLPAPQRYIYLLFGLAVSIFLHGFWDYLAQFKTWLVFFVMLLMYAALWHGCLKLWHRVTALDLDFGGEENHE